MDSLLLRILLFFGLLAAVPRAFAETPANVLGPGLAPAGIAQCLFDLPRVARTLQLRVKNPGAWLTWESHQQDVIWKARDVGRTEEADRLEDQLAAAMELEPIVKNSAMTESQGKGANNARLIRFKSGITALAKPALNSQTPQAEVGSYRLSRLWGFDFVPVTVFRKLSGKLYSLQYFIKGGRRPKNSSWNGAALNNLHFFGWLNQNTDRNTDNILEVSGRIVAIDNGETLPSKRQWRRVELTPELLVDMLSTPDTFRKFIQVSPAQIRATLDGVVDEAAIDQVLVQRERFIRAIAEYQARGQLLQYSPDLVSREVNIGR